MRPRTIGATVDGINWRTKGYLTLTTCFPVGRLIRHCQDRTVGYRHGRHSLSRRGGVLAEEDPMIHVLEGLR